MVGKPTHKEFEQIVDKRYQLENLINMNDLRKLLEDFHKIAPFPIAVLNLEGDVLLESHWEPICTRFHRVNPKTSAICAESDIHFNAELAKGDERHILYRCANGLYDAASPIMIEGQHFGNFFIGQFLLEPPDEGLFRKQAQRYGFEEEVYLEALSRVTVISEHDLKNRLNYLCGFAEFLGTVGLKEFQRDRAQEALREREASYARAVRGTSDGLWDWNVLTNEDYLSPRWKELLGYEDHELTNRYGTFFSRVHPDDTSRVEAAIQAHLEQNVPYNIDHRLRTKSGDYRWFNVRGNTERDNQGKAVLMSGAITDITDRKRAEEELQRHGAELRRSNQELERSNRELEAFAYVVSHDLQQPLSVVSSYLEMLGESVRDRLEEEEESYLDRAASSALRVQEMVDAVLGFARVDSRGGDFGQVDLGAVLEQVKTELWKEITVAKAEIINEGLPSIIADEAQMELLLQNLVSNALKFSGSPPAEIRLSSEESDDEWTILVQDNGIGIDPAASDRIFLMFQRLHTEKEFPGTGIGLAICKRIVDRHGGKIWVESEQLLGAKFFFSIPKRTSAQGED